MFHAVLGEWLCHVAPCWLCHVAPYSAFQCSRSAGTFLYAATAVCVMLLHLVLRSVYLVLPGMLFRQAMSCGFS